jgi:hypothetical protein
VAEPDDRVDDDAGDDHEEIDAEHRRHGATLPLLADGLGDRAQRFEAFRELDLGGLRLRLRLRVRLRVAVTSREEGLAQPRKGSLALSQVGSMALETLRGLALALGLARELALSRLQLLFLCRGRALPRLELGELRLARGDRLLASVQLGGAFVEPHLRLGGVGARGVQLGSLTVELCLACPEVGLEPIELDCPRLHGYGALVQLRLPALDPHFTARELRLLPLLLSLQEVSFGEATAQRVEMMLTLPACLELAGDPMRPCFEVFLALRQLALALRHALCGFAELALGLRQVVERDGAGVPGALNGVRVERLRGRRGRVSTRSPSH